MKGIGERSSLSELSEGGDQEKLDENERQLLLAMSAWTP